MEVNEMNKVLRLSQEERRHFLQEKQSVVRASEVLHWRVTMINKI